MLSVLLKGVAYSFVGTFKNDFRIIGDTLLRIISFLSLRLCIVVYDRFIFLIAIGLLLFDSVKIPSFVEILSRGEGTPCSFSQFLAFDDL